jgi:hypothetical protein
LVVEAFNWGVLDPNGEVARATLAALETGLFLTFTGHGYKRNDDGGEYDNREWIMIDMRVAQALRAAGKPVEADALVDWVTAQAVMNYDLVPENFDPFTARYQGETPMAGFGAGAYALALWERADSRPPVAQPDAGMTSPDPVVPGEVDGGGCACRTGDGARTRSGVGGRAALVVLLLVIGAAVLRYPRRRAR